MFVVSGHLYRPLLLSQSWELRGKILGGFGTHLNVFWCWVKHPRVLLVPKPSKKKDEVLDRQVSVEF